MFCSIFKPFDFLIGAKSKGIGVKSKSTKPKSNCIKDSVYIEM